MLGYARSQGDVIVAVQLDTPAVTMLQLHNNNNIMLYQLH